MTVYAYNNNIAKEIPKTVITSGFTDCANDTVIFAMEKKPQNKRVCVRV